jgi:hypothetical protein
MCFFVIISLLEVFFFYYLKNTLLGHFKIKNSARMLFWMFCSRKKNTKTKSCCNFTFYVLIYVSIKAQAYAKKMTIVFFRYFGTHNNKIHTIYKQTSVFVLIFSMLLFWFYYDLILLVSWSYVRDRHFKLILAHLTLFFSMV